jgi:hypothetical protein
VVGEFGFVEGVPAVVLPKTPGLVFVGGVQEGRDVIQWKKSGREGKREEDVAE